MKDKQEELFVQVNEQDEPIGSVTRKVANSNPNIFHRSIKVFVFNQTGKLLIQQRSEMKDTFPNCWDVSVAGHVDWGETYLDAALREMHEEVGIQVKSNALELMGKLLIRLPWETEFQQAYKVVVPNDIAIDFPKDEVSQAFFVSNSELQEMVNDSNNEWTSPAITHMKEFGLIATHTIE